MLLIFLVNVVFFFQPNVSELTRVKNSLKQEGSQNGVTPKATRRVTKQREMGFSEASIEKVGS